MHRLGAVAAAIDGDGLCACYFKTEPELFNGILQQTTEAISMASLRVRGEDGPQLIEVNRANYYGAQFGYYPAAEKRDRLTKPKLDWQRASKSCARTACCIEFRHGTSGNLIRATGQLCK